MTIMEVDVKLHYTNTGNPVDFPLAEPVIVEFDEDVDMTEIEFAENNAYASAGLFCDGVEDWNDDDYVQLYCARHGFDYDFVWLAARVLFAPAVWYYKTGKVM